MSDPPHWLNLAMSLPADASNVVSSPDHIAECLWQYGEEDVEQRVRAGLTAEQESDIAIEAGRIAHEERGLLDLALARAAVSVLEGQARPLARKKRRSR